MKTNLHTSSIQRARPAPARRFINSIARALRRGLAAGAVMGLLLLASVAQALDIKTLLGGEDGRIYDVENNGELRFYWRDEVNHTWTQDSGPIIGTGWAQYPKVFYGSMGALYAVSSDGRLLYFRDETRDGTGQVGTSGFEIGTGWSRFRWLMGDADGVIYAINNNGALLFYQHYGTNSNPMWANNGAGQQIGGGFSSFRRVFGGRDGVIYAITDEGELYWYRDLARNGSVNFANAGQALVIGNGGWNSFQHIFSTGNGHIYATISDGTLYHYQVTVTGSGNTFTDFAWANGGVAESIGTGFVSLARIVEGYCWPLSAAPGETIDFMASGNGSVDVTYLRHKANAAGLTSLSMGSTQFNAFVQPIPAQANSVGCGWSNSFRLTIPSDWVSGIYSAELRNADGETNHITFVVRPRPENRSRLAVLANMATWNAYNDWGGGGKYAKPAVTSLSFMRPNPSVSPVSGDFHLARAELWILTWLEDAGFRPDVYTDLDFERGMVTNNYRCLLLSTHPEYWTGTMYTNRLTSFLGGGGSLVYLGANGLFEQCEFWADQTGMVFPGGANNNESRSCYTWRHLGPPEMTVLGVATARCTSPSAPFAVRDASHRFFRDTGLTNGSTIGASGLNPGSVDGAAAGWEVDSSSDLAAYGTADCIVASCTFLPVTLPIGHVVLASAQNGNPAEITYYPHPGGGLVFAAGSIPFGGSLAVDPMLQKLVSNVLEEATANPCDSDQTPPVPTVASLPVVTAQCSAALPAAPTANDACDGVITATTTAPASFGQGDFLITWTFTDSHGNRSTQTQEVHVHDTLAPVPNHATLPPVTGQCSTARPAAPTATDACDGVITATTTAPATFGQGDFLITWTFTDSHGNRSTQTQEVHVHDTLAPVLSGVPANLTVTATSAAGAVVTFATPTASDNCSGSVPVTCSPASGSIFPVGTTTVTCTATDAAGNSASASFTVKAIYSWSDVLQPINADGSSVFKLGRTVPVKFRLTGASAGITTLAARLSYALVSNSVPGPVNEADSTAAATTGNLFRYDAASGQYIFNWSTSGLTTGTYQLIIDLGDGVSHTVTLALR